jgi:hypothetical protein
MPTLRLVASLPLLRLATTDRWLADVENMLCMEADAASSGPMKEHRNRRMLHHRRRVFFARRPRLEPMFWLLSSFPNFL